jgi:hypothetical protein
MKKLILLSFLIAFICFIQPVQAAEPNYIIVPGKNYAVLKLETLNSDKNTLIRMYDLYSGISATIDNRGSLHYGLVQQNIVDIIELPETFDSTYAAKMWLRENDPTKLRLRPMTIVSERVYNQWITENYPHKYEYWGSAPPGLMLPVIKPDYRNVHTPGLYKTFFQGKSIKIAKVYINHTRVLFNEDKPYINDNNEIMIPVRTLSNRLGYEIIYKTLPTGIGVLTLIKDNRKIELSVWWDYYLVNGIKI